MALHLEIQFLHLEALLQVQEQHKTTEVLSLELRNQETLAALQELTLAPLVLITTQAQEATLTLLQEAAVLLQDLAEVLVVDLEAEVLEVEVLAEEVRDKNIIYNILNFKK